MGRKRCNIYKNQLSGLFCSLNLLCLASGSSGAGTIIGIKVYGEDPSHTLTHSHSHSSLSRRLGRRVFFGVFPPSTSSASLTFSNRESDSRYSQNAVVLVSQHANGWTRGIIHASPGRKGNKTKQKRKIRSGWEEGAGGRRRPGRHVIMLFSCGAFLSSFPCLLGHPSSFSRSLSLLGSRPRAGHRFGSLSTPLSLSLSLRLSLSAFASFRCDSKSRERSCRGGS